MRLLLDTHLLLWALAEPRRLGDSLLAEVEDPGNDILFSTVSIWEIAIKTARGRPDFAVRADHVALEAIAIGFRELAITWPAAAAVAELPRLHRDPFDRLIIAQAMTEPVHLYTADHQLQLYSHLVRLV